ncbi:hypothetical protein PUMCH_003550 [Australozyma saopauloensis]|uniref:Uncharacterized protein n=1 Tax=Australozyma saopauloensis TaxID=291208 RepID=A0AAX4HE77_9ASCO|nr:hypothetical protein PUMCH_003550 [[Candida] saopauloensis]
MTLQTIYIARHGFRSNWLPPPHPPNPTGIDSDPVLAPHGEEQAVELAAHISKLQDKPQFILSSPFYRCIQTSSPIAAQLGVKIAIDRGVGEWFKRTRGIVPIPAGYEQLQPHFPDVLGDELLWNGSGIVPGADGEDENEIFARSAKFWTAFVPAFEAQYPEITSIVIVTHAATKIALGMQLLKALSVHDNIQFQGETTKLRAGACSIDKYVLESDLWTLKENGRTDFLKDGEEMNWNFDAVFEAGSDEDIKARQLAQNIANAEIKKEEHKGEEFEVRSSL